MNWGGRRVVGNWSWRRLLDGELLGGEGNHYGDRTESKDWGRKGGNGYLDV